MPGHGRKWGVGNLAAPRRNDPETIREEGINVHLAQLLRDRGLSAKGERRTRSGIPDVRGECGDGDLVILECKWEGAADLLEAQLDDRLRGFPEALGVIGVLYPGRLRHTENARADLEGTADLQYWLHGSRGAKHQERHLRQGSVAELADQLRTLPLELEGVDRVAAAASVVSYALEQAAERVAKHARISRLIADIIARTDQEKDRAAALRIGCLVLFNALAFQDRLAAANEDVPTVNESLGQGIPGLCDAWRFICAHIDYVPVFELGVDILDVLGDGPDEIQMPVIDPLVTAVRQTRTLEGHDLSGRLFHTLLTDAKFTGAYYTSVPSRHPAVPPGVSRLAIAGGLERPRISRLSERSRPGLRHRDAAHGRCNRGRTSASGRRRAARHRPAQGNGRASLARLRRPALGHPLRRHQPGPCSILKSSSTA